MIVNSATGEIIIKLICSRLKLMSHRKTPEIRKYTILLSSRKIVTMKRVQLSNIKKE